MDMKLKRLIADGAALHELQWDERIIQRVTLDMAADKLATASVESCFWFFIDTMARLYGSPTVPKEDTNLQVFVKTSLILSNTPNGVNKLISGLGDFELIKSLNVQDSTTALAQNAFIYAIARTYSKPIKKLYMRATNSPEPPAQGADLAIKLMLGADKYKYGDTTYAAKFADAEYITNMEKAHPILTTFVKTKFRFQYKQTLPVIGYLINPDLVAEE